MEVYDKRILREGFGEYEEKKSRFIACITPVTSEEDAVSFIEGKKKEFWDARHNCSAYIVGDEIQKSHCSDDGEPSGTAGRPMLEVIKREGLTNVAAVVTRYFGGVLLGTGGLVRAYQKSLKDAIEHCELIKKQEGMIFFVRTDYSLMGKLQYFFSSNEIAVIDTVYDDRVRMKILCPLGFCAEMKKKLAQSCGAGTVLEEDARVNYGITENGVHIFK